VEAPAYHAAPVEEDIEGGHEIILVAEDNEGVRRLMTKYDYEIIETADGVSAVLEFTRNREKIDLLILDSVMPGENGMAVHDEIRKADSGIKVIFMSGYTKDAVLDKGMEEKRFDFISKPVTPVDLLKKVRQALDG
jgi:DNA-binding NtrC family response regulator